MASSYSNPDGPAGEDEEGLVILTGQDRRPEADDDSPMHALPVPVDEFDQADEDRRTIDLDVGGALDLSALIAGLDRPRAPRMPRPAAPPAPDSPSRQPAEANGAVYDLGSTSPTPRTVEDQAEIDRLSAELRQEQFNVRRGMADLANYKRKAEQERQRSMREATERVLRQFLPIVDDFERSVAAASESRNFDQLIDGVQGILRNCASMLDSNGVQPVESIGKPFDPDIHEAVGTIDNSELPEDTIVEELRKGYLIDERLLRAALVRVSRHERTADVEEALPEPAAAEIAPDPDSAQPDPQ